MLKKELYKSFIKENSDLIPIFFYPEWMEIVSEDREWDVAIVKNKSTIVGIWPYVVYSKMGIKFILQPVLTPYLGPFVFYPPNQTKVESKLAFEKKVISQLIDQLPKSINVLKIKSSPLLTNWLPLYWRGFKQTTNYTYQLNLQNIAALDTGYTSSLRSDLKNIPAHISIESSTEASLVYDLASSSYAKQDATIYFSKKTFLSLDALLTKKEARHIYVAKRASGEIVACVYVFVDRKIAYLPIIGRGNLTTEESSITKNLIHYSILQCYNKGITIYDFEGSMFPQFEKVFRSFGSSQVPYHVLSKVKNKLLRFLTT